VQSKLLSANVYIGAFAIAECLRKGAQIVIGGRLTDPALVAGPMIHEFGWQPTDWDKLAAGTMAGHIAECGAQCTGRQLHGLARGEGLRAHRLPDHRSEPRR
jgi:hypothetical protein